MRSRRRYTLSFKSLNSMLGNIPLKEFQRKDLYRYVAKRREQVKSATVNRDIAAISKKGGVTCRSGSSEVEGSAPPFCLPDRHSGSG